MNVKKWIGLALLLVVFAMGWFSSDLLSFQVLAARYVDIKTIVNESKVLSMLIFTGLYFVAVALSLPIALVLTLTGAALFGWWGVISIWIGATAGAFAVFLAVRYFLHDWAETRLSGMLGHVRSEFQANPFQWALSMRLIPLIPFWMANALPALLGMSAVSFVSSTAVGILPGTLVYVGLGVGFDQIFSRGEIPDLSVFRSPEVIGPLLALGVMSVISTIVTRQKQRKQDAEPTL
jgi:uncharacterized membrane protein YdjX (TVP38/TMEM64 family)